MEGKVIGRLGDSLVMLDIRAKQGQLGERTLAFADPKSNRRITLDSRADAASMIMAMMRWYFSTED